MHRRQPDANFTALTAGGANTGHVVDVVALTADDGLLATLQDAVGAEHALWHAPSADAAVELLVGGRCGILIADLQTIMRSDAAAVLERLQNQFPELVLLATGRREEEGTVAGLISQGCVYRFLHKPVSPARANLFLATATRRYHELSDNASPSLASVKQFTRPTQRIKLIAGGVAVLLFVLALVWIWSLRDEQPPPAPAKVSPSASSQRAIVIDQQSVDLLTTQVRAALQNRDAPAANQALMALQEAQPEHPQLEALRAQLLVLSRSAKPETPAPSVTAQKPAQRTTATPARVAPIDPGVESGLPGVPTPDPTIANPTVTDRAITDQSAVSAELAIDQQVLEQLARATSLREGGQLIEPAGNNAYDVLNSIAAENSGATEVRAERQRLVFALLESTRTVLAAGDLDRADALITRADQLVPGMTNTRSLQQQIAAEREERAAASRVVQAATLKRTREVPAAYPKEAERDGTQGWVDVDFTIAVDGTTQELIVRDASPQSIFDSAALDALRKWRFEPVVRNGAPVAQRATLRVRFTLE